MVKYPVDIEIAPSVDPPIFKATATVMFPSAKAKAFVSFIFEADTFYSWPMKINSLRSEVKIVYGSIECASLFLYNYNVR